MRRQISSGSTGLGQQADGTPNVPGYTDDAANVSVQGGYVSPFPHDGEGQSVAYTATAGVVANPLAATIVDITCSTDAYIKFGVAPTATGADYYMPAGETRRFAWVTGHKVSAVQVTVAGVVYAHPVA